MDQSIESFVSSTMDDSPLTRRHYIVFGLIAAGYFVDSVNFLVFGALVADMINTHFATAPEIAVVGFAQAMGLFCGAIGQGQFTDRFGRKTVYQFNLLLFGIFTIASAAAPNYLWLAAFRFISGIGLGAEQPLCYAYASEYAPKRVRGRVLATILLIASGIAIPFATGFAIFTLDAIHWRGIWIVFGCSALVVFVLRFSLPESPRWLVAHGRGERALAVLRQMGMAEPAPGIRLVVDEVERTQSDPFLVLIRNYPRRVVAASVNFVALFLVGVGLTAWLPKIIAARGFDGTTSLQYTLFIQLANPIACLFMMFAIDRFGRKPLAVTAFVLAGIFSLAFALIPTGFELIVCGFMMMLFTQIGGNSGGIFASEVFPTNARASGFGIASGVGRLMAAFSIPTILWLQSDFGANAVFVAISVVLVTAAFAVTQMGPEARKEALDVLAPPTQSAIDLSRTYGNGFVEKVLEK